MEARRAGESGSQFVLLNLITYQNIRTNTPHLATFAFTASIKVVMTASPTTIYLDHAAATPLDPEVFSVMEPWLKTDFHNPGGLYAGAVKAQKLIESSRSDVAKELDARNQEIIFVDGGTEANNLAIQGSIAAWRKDNPHTRPHIITSAIEHSSVFELFKHLEQNCDVDYIPVDSQGLVDIKELKKLINERTVIISVAYANGETGVIQDIKEIAKTARHYRKHNESIYPYVHTDAVQAANYLSLNVLKLGVDMMTISGSKIYGPKKIAALFVKTGTKINPLIFGGEQEFALRPGTENVPYIAGFAKALEISRACSETESERLYELKEFFMDKLSQSQELNKLIFNSGCDRDLFLPHIINITIAGLSSEELVIRLDSHGIACSMRSACTSGEEGDSHVILAMREHDESNKDETGSLRFSMGRSTSKDDLVKVLEVLQTTVSSMKATKNTYL